MNLVLNVESSSIDGAAFSSAMSLSCADDDDDDVDEEENRRSVDARQSPRTDLDNENAEDDDCDK